MMTSQKSDSVRARGLRGGYEVATVHTSFYRAWNQWNQWNAAHGFYDFYSFNQCTTSSAIINNVEAVRTMKLEMNNVAKIVITTI